MSIPAPCRRRGMLGWDMSVIAFEPSTLRYSFFIYHTLKAVGCPVKFLFL
jgi:hypothetical protein